MTATEIREVVKQPTARRVSPWTSKELDALRRVAPLGARAAAEILGRSIASVKLAAHRHRISLRTTGTRAGVLLGQPRGTSWADARRSAEFTRLLERVRADLADGKIQLRDLDRALAALDAGAELCPSCGRNPIDQPDGICTGCHRRRLADAHQAAIDAHAGQQELWAARTSKVRHKRRNARKEEPHDHHD